MDITHSLPFTWLKPELVKQWHLFVLRFTNSMQPERVLFEQSYDESSWTFVIPPANLISFVFNSNIFFSRACARHEVAFHVKQTTPHLGPPGGVLKFLNRGDSKKGCVECIHVRKTIKNRTLPCLFHYPSLRYLKKGLHPGFELDITWFLVEEEPVFLGHEPLLSAANNREYGLVIESNYRRCFTPEERKGILITWLYNFESFRFGICWPIDRYCPRVVSEVVSACLFFFLFLYESQEPVLGVHVS